MLVWIESDTWAKDSVLGTEQKIVGNMINCLVPSSFIVGCLKKGYSLMQVTFFVSGFLDHGPLAAASSLSKRFFVNVGGNPDQCVLSSNTISSLSYLKPLFWYHSRSFLMF